MKEKIKFDCPYCDKPMRIELSNSTSGCHSLIEPYNSPESWHYEVYYCHCDNNHAPVLFCVHEYYFWQFSDYKKYKQACDAYKGPLTRIGYIPYGINSRGFEGLIEIEWLSLGFHFDKNRYASFHAKPGKSPFISIFSYNEYEGQELYECPIEWLALSPDQIIDNIKKDSRFLIL